MFNKTIGVVRVAVCAVATAATFGAMAQGVYLSPGEADLGLASAQVAATQRDKLKAVLLQPVVWIASWAGPGDKGQTEVIFEARGAKVVAKLRNLTYPTTCEQDVTFTADTVKFDGCYERDITLRFDPNDKDYPLKGTGAKGYEYRLQPKDLG